MNIKWLGVLFVGLSAIAAGCAVPNSSASSSMLNAFSVESDGPVSGMFSFTAKGGVGSLASQHELPLASAPMHLALTRKSAELSSLSIPLGEVTVSPSSLPPSGLHIRNLALSTEGAAPANIDVRTSDAVSLHASAPVQIAWEMEISPGQFYPLAPVKIPGLAFEIGLVDAGGEHVLTVDARCKGTCWELKGIVAVSEVGLHFEAPVTLTVAGAAAAE